MNEYAHHLQQVFDVVCRKAIPTHTEQTFHGTDRLDHLRRLHVYRSGYDARLQHSVMADYPALQQYVSRDICAQWVASYCHQTPSQQWDLNHYSIGFADKLEGDGGISAQVRALVRLESSIVHSFWAPEAEALGVQHLAARPADEWMKQTLYFHPSFVLLHLTTSANAYLQAFRAGETPQMHTGEEYLIIIRHAHEVHRLVIDAPHHAVLQALSEGVSLEQAIACMPSPPHSETALATTLAEYWSLWLRYGIFRAEDHGGVS